jgi:hypothetical protein
VRIQRLSFTFLGATILFSREQKHVNRQVLSKLLVRSTHRLLDFAFKVFDRPDLSVGLLDHGGVPGELHLAMKVLKQSLDVLLYSIQ